MAQYKIGVQKTTWVTVEANTFEQAIQRAKELVAFSDFNYPQNYEYVGGHRLPDDYE